MKGRKKRGRKEGREEGRKTAITAQHKTMSRHLCAETEVYHEPLPGQFVLGRDRNGTSRIRVISFTN